MTCLSSPVKLNNNCQVEVFQFHPSRRVPTCGCSYSPRLRSEGTGKHGTNSSSPGLQNPSKINLMGQTTFAAPQRRYLLLVVTMNSLGSQSLVVPEVKAFSAFYPCVLSTYYHHQSSGQRAQADDLSCECFPACKVFSQHSRIATAVRVTFNLSTFPM